MSIIRPVIRVLCFALVFASFAAPRAWSETSVGLRGGLSTEPDQVYVGAHLNLSALSEHVYIVPSAEVGFGNDLTTLAINGDVQYRFDRTSSVRPYAGGGLALFHWSADGGADDTNLGLDVLGGIYFGYSTGHPMFVEAKAGLSNEVPDWKFTFGINF
jgi:hypothetical protein